MLVSTGLVESVVRYCCLCMVVFYDLITFVMQENKERDATKFCVKLNKSATETLPSLTKAFKEGRENVEDDSCSGRPISSRNDQNVEVVQAVMVKDRQLSARMIAEEPDLDKNAVHGILTDHLHMRKICAKLVPKNLSGEQKLKWLEICHDLLGRLEIIWPNFFLIQ